MSKIKTIGKSVIWIMGPTSSGKTTISEKLSKELRKKNIQVIHYDGDEVRNFFGPDFGFNKENRFLVVKTIVHLANKSCDSGLNVIVSALTANQDAREYIQKKIDNLILCYIKCSIDECSQRDPKGLYKKAKSGEITTLVGYNSAYITPENPDIILDTEKFSINECIEKIETFLKL